MSLLPDYLDIPANELGRGSGVKVIIKKDMAEIGRTIAADMFEEILRARNEGRNATLIIPVGPVDGYPVLAEKLNREKVSARDVMLINMDEYLGPDGHWVPLEHPLGFRAFMDRLFYNLLDSALAPRPENRV